mmetsp:Transcript_47658/g.53118  ORF Transcript_47658/g.53118 Transcript_47658/m.53118 type:complete len:562 (+) Transcript_47658:208-1893(+)|eukprot:CAMPEP_0170812080 /NCGR_PEP_ID=MMETSP0733-20121128/35714_1 /TAXON_ID=186038 /ORGANISM="Fragilariopsis kerguelensis, Strain L26-C5" /LENGTH=561 /DNA_ID=CAMNT_0011168507 /DNA_START=148 /DNA_END=1833 /DNA_ORIENTATION=+
MMIMFLSVMLLLVFPALFVDAEPTLPESLAMKLNYQFNIFDSGTDYLKARVVDQQSYVNQTEWDNYLATNDDAMVITDAEKEIIMSYHAELLEEAHLKAKKESLIDIDAFRNDIGRVADFCRVFPRIALLHIHPDGTVNLETARNAMEQINPVINTTYLLQIGKGETENKPGLTMLYPDEIANITTINPIMGHYKDYNAEQQDFFVNLATLPKTPFIHQFPRFESVFSILDNYFKESPFEPWNPLFEDLKYKDFMERNKEFGISYAEFTQALVPPTFEAMQKYNDLLVEKPKKNSIDFVLNYNMAFIRAFSAKTREEFAQTMIKALEGATTTELSTLVGIDLLAEEKTSSALENQKVYIPIYDAWKVQGKFKVGGLTMHAGEEGPHAPENVRDAIIMGSTRIGHGIQVYNDPVITEYARRKKVPFVNSIASNWRLSTIKNNDLTLHPFIQLIRLGIPIALSTDDEGMIDTDIANECVLAISNSNVQYSELKATSYTSVTASFANETIKDSLMTKLDAKFLSFEASYEAPSPTLSPVSPAPTNILTQKLTKKRKNAKKTSKK